MAIVDHGVSSLHQHGTEFEDFLSEGAGTVLFCGDSVRESEGVESHIVYIRDIYLDALFRKKCPKKIIIIFDVLFLKKYLLESANYTLTKTR